jgi:hypothetical protein
VYIQDANSELLLPNQFAMSAATIQAFVNGTIGIWLPFRDQWFNACSDDHKMTIINDLVTIPSKINTATLNMVNFNYRATLR